MKHHALPASHAPEPQRRRPPWPRALQPPAAAVAAPPPPLRSLKPKDSGLGKASSSSSPPSSLSASATAAPSEATGSSPGRSAGACSSLAGAGKVPSGSSSVDSTTLPGCSASRAALPLAGLHHSGPSTVAVPSAETERSQSRCGPQCLRRRLSARVSTRKQLSNIASARCRAASQRSLREHAPTEAARATASQRNLLEHIN
mmetsp:Transcript_11052/g.35012  ORF Transcript_11052/g.35012 Transcript_11052/m.35012 type:complete len:202 (+) Transcript_11052:149-754(+)